MTAKQIFNTKNNENRRNYKRYKYIVKTEIKKIIKHGNPMS